MSSGVGIFSSLFIIEKYEGKDPRITLPCDASPPAGNLLPGPPHSSSTQLCSQGFSRDRYTHGDMQEETDYRSGLA